MVHSKPGSKSQLTEVRLLDDRENIPVEIIEDREYEPENNGSQLKNPDISGAIFTSSLSILILNSKCVEGARDVRVL